MAKRKVRVYEDIGCSISDMTEAEAFVESCSLLDTFPEYDEDFPEYDEEEEECEDVSPLPSWKTFYNLVLTPYALDEIPDYRDIDKKVFVITEDGEAFRTKDGTWYQTCWRYEGCKIFTPDEGVSALWDKYFKEGKVSWDE